jgi:NADH-quinone oxidoreductase subunit K
MNNLLLSQTFLLTGVFVLLLVVVAAYCLLVSRNLIRILIGIELLTKAVTLLLVVAGHVSGKMALAQSLIITLIVVEVVVIAVAAGIIIGAHKHNKGLDVRELRNLKG